MTDKDTEAALERFRRRLRENPLFRDRAMEILRRYRAEKAETSSLNYLDNTLKSPRLRSILEEAKRDSDRRKAEDAR